MLWRIVDAVSLLTGSAAFAWGLFFPGGGWNALTRFFFFLVAWLPATGILTITVWWDLAAGAGWPWPFAAGVLALVALVQLLLLMRCSNSPAAYCFLPLFLIAISATALLQRNGSAPWLAAAGLAAVALAYAIRHRLRR